MDLLLSDDHDFVFEDGDFKVTQTIPETLEQRLKIRLLTYRDEWYLDTTTGVPYYESILGKNRAKETIDLIFKSEILSEDAVEELLEFTSTVDDHYRIYSIHFKVRSKGGKEIVPVSLQL